MCELGNVADFKGIAITPRRENAKVCASEKLVETLTVMGARPMTFRFRPGRQRCEGFPESVVPFQGDAACRGTDPQGVALGYVVRPLRGN